MRYLILLILAGCAVSEEAVDKARVDEANWLNCASIYKRYGKPTYHDHIHGDRVTRADIRTDLWMNNCRPIVGDEWLEY